MNTKALRQKILDLAIHGKLVPQDPNDEPASVLLERIRAEKERLIKEGKIKRSKKTKTTSDKPHYENVPFEVPSSWVWSTVNEINMYNSKNVDPAKQKENTFELYSVPIFPTNTPEIIKGEKIGSAKQSVENGDVLLCKINPKINRVWFVKNRTENTMIASSEWIVIRNKFMLTDYLVFCFMSPYFRDLMENNVSGVGGSLTRAQPSMVANYAIPIPPLQEQKRIITEIKHWFELIEVIDQSKECLQGTIKKAKSKILDLAIHGKLVPQDPTDEPASELLKRINPKAEITSDNGHYQKNEQFEIPSTWVLCKLGAVNEIARGGSPRPIKDYLTNDANSINWIKIGDTTKDGKYINSVKEKIRPEGVKKSRLVHKGDFLLTNSMSYGRPYILNVDGCIHDGWLVISPIGKAYTSDFLYYLLSSSFAYDQFTNVASGGVVTNLNSDKVADTIFPLPPYTEQERIVAKIEEIFAQLDAIEASL